MTERAANMIGYAGAAAGALALGAQVCVISLPYRLSPVEGRVFGTAITLAVLGLVLALGLGIVALRGAGRSRRLAFMAIALGILTFLLVLMASCAHSVSRPIA